MRPLLHPGQIGGQAPFDSSGDEFGYFVLYLPFPAVYRLDEHELYAGRQLLFHQGFSDDQGRQWIQSRGYYHSSIIVRAGAYRPLV